MKFLSYEYRGKAGFGAVKGDGVVDLAGRLAGRYATLKDLLAGGAMAEAQKEVDASSADVPLNRIDYLPPITNPGKIVCIGINYSEHAAEGNAKVPEKPLIFTRFAESVVGHRQPLVRPYESDQFDYEVELCAVIGKVARRVAAADALSTVAGYTVFNDGSIRDWQRHTSHFTPGKNFFRSGSAGPWLVTADEIPDPQRLRLSTTINGTVLQNGTTAQMVYGVASLIEYISTFTALYPGDLIATGTPSGVGFARKPPVYMKPGDDVVFEIEKIGVLRNTVVDG
jgi:2-keto-4-pentenoate hydratase/2-oxohepta-3-ene-1,7-dioic acid hydratase in catechol pathway